MATSFLYDTDLLPDTRDPNGKGNKRNGKGACRPGWQLTATFVTSCIGLVLFSGLLLGIVLKGGALEETSRATISMHDDTTKMKEDVGAWFKDFRAHFPSNQETMTTEQVLDSIDKSHATIVWLDQVRRNVSPDQVSSIISNVNRLVGNATLLIEMFAGVLAPNGGSAQGRERFMGSATNILTKGSELLNSVTPTEFHSAFETGHAAVQSFVRLSQSVDHAKVAKLVDSASVILGDVDANHVVSVISELSRGAIDIIKRFSRPGGLRLSLPVEELMSPEPQAIPFPGLNVISLPKDPVASRTVQTVSGGK